MSQDTPLIELIIQNVETALKNIRRENGYRTTVNLVSRILKNWDELSADQFPAVMLTTGGSQLTEETNKDIADAFQLILWGYVRFNEHAAKEDIAQVQLVNLKSDVIETMYADPTRANLAEEQNIGDFSTDEGSVEPFGVFRLAFRITTSYSAKNTGLKQF